MNVKKIDSVTFGKDSVVLFLTQDQASGNGKLIFRNKAVTDRIKELKRKGDFRGEKGEASYFYLGKTLVLLAGMGKEKKLRGYNIREAVSKVLLSSKLSKHRNVEIVPHDKREETQRALIEGVVIGTYRWKKYVTKKKDDKTVDKKNVYVFIPGYPRFSETVKIAESVNYARDLVNENADVMNSQGIEKEVRKIVKGKKNVRLTILKGKDLKRKGLNLHLAVNKGSRNEPMLIIAGYSGGKGKYTALIGKGITFDSGGLNLKPTGYIETMRQDMGGTAAVLGALKSVLEIRPKKNILFVLAVAENSIGSSAIKPGDVIKSYDGKYVEIANTDAEGRLVLADANAYVTKNYEVRAVVDIATLTGAVIVALGHDYAGVMSNKQGLADKLVKTGKETGDLAWQLPIYDDLKEHVKSKYADIKNVGLPKGAAGTISAGEFLRQFVGKGDWAHVDIGGTAFVDNGTRSYYGYGATGFGVRLLTNYVLKYA